ncbi:MAG: class I SAM-dependent methyltransferase [Caldilineaceae bacterium]|nr:class I SAM-dependent methyltransferase [Caldilineaceae bacterium]MBP8108800.1 class I SAM-dependent methyltransferase [Caldilineaceae bacterium]MBP8123950.1 class I SAM-dependent methyltransferase [Caldilineaceae bacterium]MBP9073459.1 class I SAM-dependent methyltransferase [Caldilineaceae bacterium]
MNHADLLAVWQHEESQPFTGWDFSYLDGRMTQDELPWDYVDRAGALMDGAASVLDMDTGGGERLLEMRPRWPGRVVATEEYPPNLALARARLAPLGVDVRDVAISDDGPMPFGDGEFDLVLNRHSAFNAGEVARILALGGSFFTQQVHGLWAWDLLEVFGASPQWPNATPAHYVPRLQKAGLEIVQVREWSGQTRFTDVGAIVYYLKATPWEVPGFSVATHQAGLFALQERLEKRGDLAFFAGYYLIEARKSVALP